MRNILQYPSFLVFKCGFSACSAFTIYNVSGLQMGLEIFVALTRLCNCHSSLDFHSRNDARLQAFEAFDVCSNIHVMDIVNIL